MSSNDTPPPLLASMTAPVGTTEGLDATLLAEIATLRAQAEALTAQIEPLHEARWRLHLEEQAAWDLLGETATTDAGLIEAYRHDSTAAYTRLRAAARDLHRDIYNIHLWQPNQVGNPLVDGDHTQEVLGAEVHLDGDDTAPVDPDQGYALASGLLAFADKFGPTQQILDAAAATAAYDDPRLGKTKVTIMDRDCSQTRSLEIWHTLSASGTVHAILLNTLWGSGTTLAEGELGEVCIQAIKAAYAPTPEDY